MRPTISCLAIDDDPGVRDVVSFNLRSEGMTVHVADSGHMAEKLALEVEPDLILLDVMMPGRDGLDVLRGLKSSEATRDIPVVLLTARASDEEIWQGWQAGADYYLTKPFNVAHLVEYLGLVVAERRRALRRPVA